MPKSPQGQQQPGGTHAVPIMAAWITSGEFQDNMKFGASEDWVRWREGARDETDISKTQ